MGTIRPGKEPRLIRPLTIVGIANIAVVVVLIAIAVINFSDRIYIDQSYCSHSDRDSQPYDAEAAPYRGDGPHPVLVLYDESTRQASLPPRWTAGSVEELQLVICELGFTEESDGVCVPIGGGEDRHSEPSYDRIYKFDVIEAATGRKVRSFTSGSQGGCGSDLSRLLDEQMFVDELRRFVEKPAFLVR